MGLNASYCFSQDISKNIVGEILLLMVFIRNTGYSQITCYLRKLNSKRIRCKKSAQIVRGWKDAIRENKKA